MKFSRRTVLHLCAVVLLLAGLAGGAALHALASRGRPDAAEYVFSGDGSAAAVSPLDSRAERREMALYGGWPALLTAELDEWCADLLYGGQLALAAVAAGAFGSAGCLWLAARTPAGRG